MAGFEIIYDDQFLTEAKSYTIDNAKKYGLEKAIIINTLGKLKKFKEEEIFKYFPEFDEKTVKQHLEELIALGIIK